jgi:hypothetical protein
MEAFDFDRQFRLMELADNEEEVARLSAQTRAYVGDDPERRAAWSEAISRLKERSMIELTLVRELLGQPVAV